MLINEVYVKKKEEEKRKGKKKGKRKRSSRVHYHPRYLEPSEDIT